MEMIHGGVSGLRSCCLCLPYLQKQPLFRSARGLFSCSRRLLTTACAKTGKDNKQKVVVISGPTGAGKSRLALELAKRLNGEIISADSVQVYQGLDIGTAKPSLSDRKEVPHYLIDILQPSEGISTFGPYDTSCDDNIGIFHCSLERFSVHSSDYSVGQFFEDARLATRHILDKGRVPIITGGTGLYLRWFIYGKPDVPKASPEIISEVSSELDELQRNEDWAAAVELVVKAGDAKAQLLPANDWYRLRRSLEIIKSSGSPPSAFQVPYDSFKEQIGSTAVNPQEVNSSAYAIEETIPKELDYDFICFFLSSQRFDLYRSIDYRCEDMLSGRDGILSEAQLLLDGGLLPNSNSATRAIGYRQAMEYLLMCRQNGGISSEREFYRFLFEFQKVSRNFAKRQLTWFRNEQIYHWLDGSKPMEKVLKFVYDAYYDKSGILTVPQDLRMKKDTNPREASALKSYRPQNRLFVKREDCYPVLEWIRRTQGSRNELELQLT